MSNSLWPHRLKHARLPCPSMYFTISLSLLKLGSNESMMQSNHLVLFFSCLQSFPVSGSFLMNQLFASGGQGIGPSASVLPMNIQGWFPLGLTGLISLQSKGLSRVFSSTKIQKHKFFCSQPFFLWLLCLYINTHTYTHTTLTSIHDYWKNIALTRWTFVDKVMSLLL